ncbi:DUF1990 family protein [Blastococcus brunescens]|uniref:DUF1990 family protein n=1 Tax=Blastococcus brunescens TaxID=1564165 RepID=A0ABZ1B255_9ACTN|nr:DUF1990 family protein [Blastococcus sp. BMG 8361]WRL64901.1 DUF1990 family protein [Blastococcus sp. BMG 8361]
MALLRSTRPADLLDAPLTYDAVGTACSGAVPEGFRSARRSVVVGSGRTAFERAATAVFDWQAQRAVGLRVRASGPSTAPGTVVVLTAGLPRLGYDIPCRVVWAKTGAPSAASPTAPCPATPRAARSASSSG